MFCVSLSIFEQYNVKICISFFICYLFAVHISSTMTHCVNIFHGYSCWLLFEYFVLCNYLFQVYSSCLCVCVHVWELWGIGIAWLLDADGYPRCCLLTPELTTKLFLRELQFFVLGLLTSFQYFKCLKSNFVPCLDAVFFKRFSACFFCIASVLWCLLVVLSLMFQSWSLPTYSDVPLKSAFQ